MSVMEKVQYFDRNKEGRDFVIGDLHGMFHTFQTLLKEINFDKTKDRMFSVGDLVDRGPENMECLELLYEPWFHAVRGNHEDMMIYAIKHNNTTSWEHWIANGGSWHLHQDQTLLKELANKADELPYVIVIGKNDEKRFNIVHAEMYKAQDENLATDEDIDDWFFSDYHEQGMIWGRTIPQFPQKFEKVDLPYGLSTTFCGHTPAEMPKSVMTHMFIDTGAVFSKEGRDYHLSCVNLDFPNQVIMLNVNTGKVKTVQVL
jgi:serine/threonine protein phosphatase 1